MIIPMGLLIHGAYFIAAGLVLWLASRVLVDSIDHYAKRNHRARFVVAFFVLGLVTSISEFSVAVNALSQHVPEVSAGNLLGASFVIFFLIVPLLAIGNRGITLSRHLTVHCAFVAFVAILIPTMLAIDGAVSVLDGALALLAYVSVIVCVYRANGHHANKASGAHIAEQLADLIKVLVAAFFIFIAGRFLVQETVYFAEALSMPASLIGLLVLSIGTNVPELTIAIRSILSHRAEIAFGDYLGSSLTNTLIFGFLPLIGGSYSVSGAGVPFAILFAVGTVFLFIATETKRTISRTEGIALVAFYAAFLILQTGHIAMLTNPS